ncbi:teichoic acid poly(glycerol phosphate) polymerase [Lachnospiraceae bacterium]|nr:teichoic acid poly(glycerol phosphate) polymerase [Lachnospiraceae bacterium]
MSSQIKLLFKYYVTLLIRNLLKIFWIIPIKNKEFLFLSFDGKQYSDSPKYISEYLQENVDGLEFTWAFNEIGKYDYLLNRGFKLIDRKSLLFIITCTNVKYIVTNNYIPSYIPIRKSQILLNTWHGGSPLKTVGFMESNPDPYNVFYYKLQNDRYTAFLSSSVFVTEGVLMDSFHYYGQVLPYGMPRNSILFTDHEDVINKVYNYFNLSRSPNSKIIIYAPTFRGSADEGFFLPQEQQLDIDGLLDILEEIAEDHYYFLFRAHHAMADSISSNKAIIATDYPDMQELLCAADILITDYSSCMGDMALMKKPVFLYTPDLEDYISSRGFYWDIYSLPFPIAKTNSSFFDVIKAFDVSEYEAGVQAYLDRLGSYESADSTQKAVEWILNQK